MPNFVEAVVRSSDELGRRAEIHEVEGEPRERATEACSVRPFSRHWAASALREPASIAVRSCSSGKVHASPATTGGRRTRPKLRSWRPRRNPIVAQRAIQPPMSAQKDANVSERESLGRQQIAGQRSPANASNDHHDGCRRGE